MVNHEKRPGGPNIAKNRLGAQGNTESSTESASGNNMYMCFSMGRRMGGDSS